MCWHLMPRDILESWLVFESIACHNLVLLFVEGQERPCLSVCINASEQAPSSCQMHILSTVTQHVQMLQPTES